MSYHVVLRNSRYELESSSSPAAMSARTGFIEGAILLALTNSPLFFLGPAALSAITTALAAVAVTAAVVGVQYLLTPKPPKPEDGKAPRTQSIPPRIYAIGRNRIAGYFMCWDSERDILISVQAICGHRVTAFVQFWVHDDEVTRKTNGFVERMPDGRYKQDRLWIGYRVGNTPEIPYPEVVALLGPTGRWSNDHRGDGQASLAYTARAPDAENFQEVFPHGTPSISAEIDGAAVYDWRDPTQSLNNPGTWKYSKNAALCLVWHYCHNPFGTRQDFNRAILPRLAMWTEEANICDEDVPLAEGGTEKRYEVNGWATTETDPVAVENSILAACDGHLVRLGDGSLVLTVGKFRESRVQTITSADITGHTIQSDYAEEETMNRLIPKFTYPDTGFTSTDTDYFESSADQLRDGRILAQDANYEWVHQWRQARRLALREWRRRQEKLHGTLNLRLSGLNAVYSRWVRINDPIRFPTLSGMLIENRRSVISLMQGGAQMDWVKHPANIDAWNPATDEGAKPPVPNKTEGEGMPAAEIASVQSVPSSGSVSLRVGVTSIGRIDLTPVVSYRVKDAGNGQPGSWISQAPDTWSETNGVIYIDTGNVPNDRALQVKANWRASRNTLGPDSAIFEVNSTADLVAPQGLLNFSANGFTDTIQVNFSTRNDSALATVVIYRVPFGQTLDKTTHKFAEPGVAPGISYALPFTSASGSFQIYAEPMNRSKVAGPMSGPSSANVG